MQGLKHIYIRHVVECCNSYIHSPYTVEVYLCKLDDDTLINYVRFSFISIYRKSCIPKTVPCKFDMEFQAQPTMTLDNSQQQAFTQVAQPVAQPVMMQGVQGLPIQFLQQAPAQFPIQGVQGQQVDMLKRLTLLYMGNH